ncbi:MAG TPA: DHHA1 domain-containing protein [Nitrososphaera sp.]|jgi:RecJ-like exonuclease|nr:DHHA1 domain-containing protein [Nitrososphaera sp.]
MSIVCISHKEDVDGLCSAVIIKAAVEASKVILVDYSNMISKLEKVAESPEKIDQLFVCDLGLSKKNEEKFVELLGKLGSAGAQVTYIDHHDVSKEILSELKKAGVTLVHTVDECTSVQAYTRYKKKLPANAAFFAAMGALTDYMETRPLASLIVPRFDRQFLMLEATSLSYMISANQHNDEFLTKAVDTLAKMKYPHDIRGGFDMAEKYAKNVARAVETIQDSIVLLDNLAHAPSTVELSSSMVVNFVLGTSEKSVAMVYKFKDNIKSYIFSVRGSSECKIHLGRLVNEVASSLGGSGGGHDRAAGAVVPKEKLEEFIKTMDCRVG